MAKNPEACSSKCKKLYFDFQIPELQGYRAYCVAGNSGKETIGVLPVNSRKKVEINDVACLQCLYPKEKTT